MRRACLLLAVSLTLVACGGSPTAPTSLSSSNQDAAKGCDIGPDSLVWRPGMADWLPLRDDVYVDPKGTVRWRFVEVNYEKRASNEQIRRELTKIK